MEKAERIEAGQFDRTGAGVVAGPAVTQPAAKTHPASVSLLKRLAARSATVMGTRSFRQASLFVVGVVLAGSIAIWLMFEAANDLISRQTIETMSVEAQWISAVATSAGQKAVIESISANARQGDGRIYLIEDLSGRKLAGNLDRWPAELSRTAGGGTFRFQVVPDRDGGRRLAAGVVALLPGDLRLLVGRELQAQRQLAHSIRDLFLTGFGGIALVGLLAGLVSSRLSLGRISEITRTSDAIMAGNFSGRVPLSGAGDELDHLAGNLNIMLERIELLVAGLREVSDNIAHDLKTPLTRLRSRAEAALSEAEGGPGQPGLHRETLGQIIEDADSLIKTFDALLLIARLEAGAQENTAETFDLGMLAEDMAELYGPVAEEAGLQIVCALEPGVRVRANRHLVGQAMANLIDNAIKYGVRAGPDQDPQGGRGKIEVGVIGRGGEAVTTVADQGRGVPAEDRERVLKRFVRLEASRTRAGTGLGLSLVAAVARMSNGSLRLEDNAPGLRIELALPRCD